MFWTFSTFQKKGAPYSLKLSFQTLITKPPLSFFDRPPSTCKLLFHLKSTSSISNQDRISENCWLSRDSLIQFFFVNAKTCRISDCWVVALLSVLLIFIKEIKVLKVVYYCCLCVINDNSKNVHCLFTTFLCIFRLLPPTVKIVFVQCMYFSEKFFATSTRPDKPYISNHGNWMLL